MRNISESIKGNYKCAALFAPIMTGHGTSSENASAARYTDWITSTHRAFLALKSRTGVSKVIVVGYSTGGSLALRLLHLIEDSEFPDALVLISPGTRYKNRNKSFFAHALNFFNVKHYPKKSEINPFNLRSSVINMLVQFNRLTKKLRSEWGVTVEKMEGVPTLVVAEKDDPIVDAQTTLDMLCMTDADIHISYPTELARNASCDSKTRKCRAKINGNKHCTYSFTDWFRSSHVGMMVSPRNQFISSVNHYCKYSEIADIIKKKIVEPIDPVSEKDVVEECVSTIESWSETNGQTPDLKIRPQENQYFHQMMDGIVFPFLKRSL